MNKLTYLWMCLKRLFIPKKCPFCGSKEFVQLQRKYLITTLLKCKKCGLNHRHPTDDPKFLEKFYQSDYHVNVEMMTDLPSDTELATLKSNNFEPLRDFAPILDAIPSSADRKLVDYGCSWGYNVFKLKNTGYDAVGYELSRPRAGFGEQKLGVQIATDNDAIRTGNDFFYSSHVIEHLASIGDFIELSKQKLVKDGIFIAFCPNGSDEFRRRRPDTFTVTWGSLHPNYLDIEFAQYAFRNNPYLLLTSDWPYDIEKIKAWDGKSQVTDTDRGGYELMIIAKPNVQIETAVKA